MICYPHKGYTEASGVDLRPKINVIKDNTHKYSVSAVCKFFNVSRSTHYYESKSKKNEIQLFTDIVEIFRRRRNNYGTRKIKQELKKMGKQVSRRRISRIMKQEVLVSNYTSHNLNHIRLNVMRIESKIL